MIEAPPLSTFECPPVLPENPLSEDGNWTQTSPAQAPMQKVSAGSRCVATDSSHGLANYSHWTRETFDSSAGNVQAWACIEGGQLGAAVETWRVALWIEVGPSVKGYLAMMGGGLSKDYFLRRYDGGFADFTGLVDIGSPGGAYPHRLGIAINGGDIEVWSSDTYTSPWILRGSAPDNTYRGKFYAGIAVEDPTSGGLSISCFGALVPMRSQFFRWIFN